MRRLVYLLPGLAFAALAFFLFRSLMAPSPDVIPSALIDKPAPQFRLPALAGKGFSRADLTAGHVSVVNMFASWCIPCRTEAEPLAAVARLSGVLVYGYVWKDTPEKARAFLDETGNSYAAIVVDQDGRDAVDWGVYGVPETYVVDGRGIVRLKLVGALTPSLISGELLPAIYKARENP